MTCSRPTSEGIYEIEAVGQGQEGWRHPVQGGRKNGESHSHPDIWKFHREGSSQIQKKWGFLKNSLNKVLLFPALYFKKINTIFYFTIKFADT